jgi:hypothetical protein
MKLFCDGVGVQFPDGTNASRRMKAGEFELCQKNGVKEIVEVKIGYDGIVVANSKKGPALKLTTKDIFLALAKEVPDPKGGEGAAVQRGQHWPVTGLAHVKGFAADTEKPALRQARQDSGKRIAARPAGLQAARHGHTMLVKMEIARAEGECAGQFRCHESHLHAAHVKAKKAGGGGDVVAGGDMPGEAIHAPI